MASLQDIRRRIRSVKNTQKITNAMHMVASSRLRHAKEAATSNKPYAEKVAQVVHDIAANAGDFSHPLLTVHEEGKQLFLVLAADKGLAGAYSSSEKPTYEHAREIAQYLIDRFESGEVKDIHMVYTRFISAVSCVPETVRLLPFQQDGERQAGPHAEYIYEPSAEVVLGHLLPQYLVTVIYAALLQAAASELSSRVNAMSNATDNAEELVAQLDLHYNKVRQAGITREITEIVGGAEALK